MPRLRKVFVKDSYGGDDVLPAGAHLDTTTRRGSAKRNAAFTLQHGAMLTTRQPEGCVPVVVSRCAQLISDGNSTLRREFGA